MVVPDAGVMDALSLSDRCYKVFYSNKIDEMTMEFLRGKEDTC